MEQNNTLFLNSFQGRCGKYINDCEYVSVQHLASEMFDALKDADYLKKQEIITELRDFVGEYEWEPFSDYMQGMAREFEQLNKFIQRSDLSDVFSLGVFHIAVKHYIRGVKGLYIRSGFAPFDELIDLYLNIYKHINDIKVSHFYVAGTDYTRVEVDIGFEKYYTISGVSFKQCFEHLLNLSVDLANVVELFITGEIKLVVPVHSKGLISTHIYQDRIMSEIQLNPTIFKNLINKINQEKNIPKTIENIDIEQSSLNYFDNYNQKERSLKNFHNYIG